MWQSFKVRRIKMQWACEGVYEVPITQVMSSKDPRDVLRSIEKEFWRKCETAGFFCPEEVIIEAQPHLDGLTTTLYLSAYVRKRKRGLDDSKQSMCGVGKEERGIQEQGVPVPS